MATVQAVKWMYAMLCLNMHVYSTFDFIQTSSKIIWWCARVFLRHKRLISTDLSALEIVRKLGQLCDTCCGFFQRNNILRSTSLQVWLNKTIGFKFLYSFLLNEVWLFLLLTTLQCWLQYHTPHYTSFLVLSDLFCFSHQWRCIYWKTMLTVVSFFFSSAHKFLNTVR